MRNSCPFPRFKGYFTYLEGTLHRELKGLSCHSESGMCSLCYLAHTTFTILEKITSANQHPMCSPTFANITVVRLELRAFAGH